MDKIVLVALAIFEIAWIVLIVSLVVYSYWGNNEAQRFLDILSDSTTSAKEPDFSRNESVPHIHHRDEWCTSETCETCKKNKTGAFENESK